MMFLTASERRAALVIVFLLLLGSARDLWRAHHPRFLLPRAPATGALHPESLHGSDPSRAAAGEDAVADRMRDPVAVADTAPRLQSLDLNRASAAELDGLPGVGPVLAGRIVEQRRKYGPFRSVDELLAVRGIGPRLLERLRSRVIVGGGGG